MGTETAGVVGNDDVLIRQLIEAGKKAGESYWQLPALPECKEALKSDVADLLNSAGREAAVSAADCLSVNLSKQGYPGPILISAVLLPLLKLRVLKLRVVPDLASAL